MTHYINNIFALGFVLASVLVSCSSDEPSSKSIFSTDEVERTEFDKWLKTNYVDTYNLEFNYLYNDKLTNNYYNVLPASIDKSQAMAILMKHVWMDAYTELAGTEFLKANSFRQIQLIGSAQYEDGSITLGTAEGGLKVLLYRVNELDTDDIYICQDDPYREKYETPLDLNYWYFHTMHHEYCHILTQRKNYTTDFQTVSAGKYRSSDWVNLNDESAAAEGFVTGYASSEYNEDFAETYACYVTFTPEGWQKILDKSVVTTKDTKGNVISSDSTGYKAINQKLEIVKSYFHDTWKIDLDSLRDVVTRRGSEAKNLKLTL